MRAPFVALTLAFGCGGDRARSPVPEGGVAPQLDALVAALADGSAQRLIDALDEPLGVSLYHAHPIAKLVGAKGRLVGLEEGWRLVTWDAKTGRPLSTFKSIFPGEIALSRDGERIAICSGPSADVIDLGTGVHHKIDTHVVVTGCGWLVDGRFVIAGTGLSTYDAKTLAPIETLLVEGGAKNLAILESGEVIIGMAAPETEWRWSGKGADKPTVGPPGPPARDTFRDWDMTPRGLLDPRTQRPVFGVSAAKQVVGFGDHVAAIDETGGVKLWSIAGVLLGHADAIAAIAVRKDRMLTTSRDGTARVWRNGGSEHRIDGTIPLVGGGFVTDTRIVIGHAQAVRLIDLDSGAQLAEHAVAGELRCMRVRADGHVELATETEIYALDAVLRHREPLATSPCGPVAARDGDRVATASGGDVAVGELRIRNHLGDVTALAFSGDWLAVGYASGALRLVPITPAAATARACGLLRRFERVELAPGC